MENEHLSRQSFAPVKLTHLESIIVFFCNKWAEKSFRLEENATTGAPPKIH